MNRPTGVTILAVLSFLVAFLLGCAGLLAFAGGALVFSIIGSLSAFVAGASAVVIAGVFAALAAVYALNGLGLLQLRQWARTLSIVLLIFALFMAVFGALSALVHFRILVLLRELIVIAVDLYLLKYLNTAGVKAAFRIAPRA
jgi:hypothetical protein